MNEIELRFVIDGRTGRQLWARAEKLHLATGCRTARTLRSIYLDTPEHTLRKSGMTLRLRREGRSWTQSVATAGGGQGGTQPPDGLEIPAPGGRPRLEAIPDASVRGAIMQRVNGSPLQQVCDIVIRRTARELSLGEGTRAELAIELATIRSNGHSADLHQAAIELLDGSPAGLFDIAHALFSDGGLIFSRSSDVARGYRLAEAGEIEPPRAPRYACPVALDPKQTTEQAARDIVRECFDQIASNMVAVRQLDDPEGPHQLRVGLRRLRSAFSVFAPVLQSPELTRLNEEARWLGQEVGRLRDLDVVANDLVRREAAAYPDEPGLPGLADALSGEAAEVRDELRKRLAEPRAQAFLIDLVRFVEMRGWFMPQDFAQTERLAEPVARLAETALDRHWKKVRKSARGLESLDAARRHELRKQAKKLRYAVEFFSPLYPAKRVEPFVKRLKALQTAFGDLNDAATVKAMFTGTDRCSTCELPVQRAIGWLIGASQLRADDRWTGAKGLWRDLRETGPFWK